MGLRVVEAVLLVLMLRGVSGDSIDSTTSRRSSNSVVLCVVTTP